MSHHTVCSRRLQLKALPFHSAPQLPLLTPPVPPPAVPAPVPVAVSIAPTPVSSICTDSSSCSATSLLSCERSRSCPSPNLVPVWSPSALAPAGHGSRSRSRLCHLSGSRAPSSAHSASSTHFVSVRSSSNQLRMSSCLSFVYWRTRDRLSSRSQACSSASVLASGLVWPIPESSSPLDSVPASYLAVSARTSHHSQSPSVSPSLANSHVCSRSSVSRGHCSRSCSHSRTRQSPLLVQVLRRRGCEASCLVGLTVHSCLLGRLPGAGLLLLAIRDVACGLHLGAQMRIVRRSSPH